MSQGLAVAPSVLYRVYQLPLVAEAYGIVGQPEEGLRVLVEALAAVSESGQSFFASEVYRLKGELLRQQITSNTSQAETCLHQALDIARSQQAKSLELRAATSLARLWQAQDKRAEAREVLTPIYEWFTEGFDTADLQEAKSLLTELEA